MQWPDMKLTRRPSVELQLRTLHFTERFEEIAMAIGGSASLASKAKRASNFNAYAPFSSYLRNAVDEAWRWTSTREERAEGFPFPVVSGASTREILSLGESQVATALGALHWIHTNVSTYYSTSMKDGDTEYRAKGKFCSARGASESKQTGKSTGSNRIPSLFRPETLSRAGATETPSNPIAEPCHSNQRARCKSSACRASKDHLQFQAFAMTPLFSERPSAMPLVFHKYVAFHPGGANSAKGSALGSRGADVQGNFEQEPSSASNGPPSNCNDQVFKLQMAHEYRKKREVDHLKERASLLATIGALLAEKILGLLFQRFFQSDRLSSSDHDDNIATNADLLVRFMNLCMLYAHLRSSGGSPAASRKWIDLAFWLSRNSSHASSHPNFKSTSSRIARLHRQCGTVESLGWMMEMAQIVENLKPLQPSNASTSLVASKHESSPSSSSSNSSDASGKPEAVDVAPKKPETSCSEIASQILEPVDFTNAWMVDPFQKIDDLEFEKMLKEGKSVPSSSSGDEKEWCNTAKASHWLLKQCASSLYERWLRAQGQTTQRWFCAQLASKSDHPKIADSKTKQDVKAGAEEASIPTLGGANQQITNIPSQSNASSASSATSDSSSETKSVFSEQHASCILQLAISAMRSNMASIGKCTRPNLAIPGHPSANLAQESDATSVEGAKVRNGGFEAPGEVIPPLPRSDSRRSNAAAAPSSLSATANGAGSTASIVSCLASHQHPEFGICESREESERVTNIQRAWSILVLRCGWWIAANRSNLSFLSATFLTLQFHLAAAQLLAMMHANWKGQIQASLDTFGKLRIDHHGIVINSLMRLFGHTRPSTSADTFAFFLHRVSNTNWNPPEPLHPTPAPKPVKEKVSPSKSSAAVLPQPLSNAPKYIFHQHFDGKHFSESPAVSESDVRELRQASGSQISLADPYSKEGRKLLSKHSKKGEAKPKNMWTQLYPMEDLPRAHDKGGNVDSPHFDEKSFTAPFVDPSSAQRGAKRATRRKNDSYGPLRQANKGESTDYGKTINLEDNDCSKADLRRDEDVVTEESSTRKGKRARRNAYDPLDMQDKEWKPTNKKPKISTRSSSRKDGPTELDLPREIDPLSEEPILSTFNDWSSSSMNIGAFEEALEHCGHGQIVSPLWEDGVEEEGVFGSLMNFKAMSHTDEPLSTSEISHSLSSDLPPSHFESARQYPFSLVGGSDEESTYNDEESFDSGCSFEHFQFGDVVAPSDIETSPVNLNLSYSVAREDQKTDNTYMVVEETPAETQEALIVEKQLSWDSEPTSDVQDLDATTAAIVEAANAMNCAFSGSYDADGHTEATEIEMNQSQVHLTYQSHQSHHYLSEGASTWWSYEKTAESVGWDQVHAHPGANNSVANSRQNWSSGGDYFGTQQMSSYPNVSSSSLFVPSYSYGSASGAPSNAFSASTSSIAVAPSNGSLRSGNFTMVQFSFDGKTGDVHLTQSRSSRSQQAQRKFEQSKTLERVTQPSSVETSLGRRSSRLMQPIDTVTKNAFGDLVVSRTRTVKKKKKPTVSRSIYTEEERRERKRGQTKASVERRRERIAENLAKLASLKDRKKGSPRTEEDAAFVAPVSS